MLINKAHIENTTNTTPIIIIAFFISPYANYQKDITENFFSSFVCLQIQLYQIYQIAKIFDLDLSY